MTRRDSGEVPVKWVGLHLSRGLHDRHNPPSRRLHAARPSQTLGYPPTVFLFRSTSDDVFLVLGCCSHLSN